MAPQATRRKQSHAVRCHFADASHYAAEVSLPPPPGFMDKDQNCMSEGGEVALIRMLFACLQESRAPRRTAAEAVVSAFPIFLSTRIGQCACVYSGRAPTTSTSVHSEEIEGAATGPTEEQVRGIGETEPVGCVRQECYKSGAGR